MIVYVSDLLNEDLYFFMVLVPRLVFTQSKEAGYINYRESRSCYLMHWFETSVTLRRMGFET